MSVMRMGSEKRPVVKATEWFQPFTPLTNSLAGSELWGAWQSLQVATALWLPLVQPSYWSHMMWQLAQAPGSSLR